jgi:hypothetical protein
MTETKSKNETIMIQWNGVLFSENIYAYFKYHQAPVLSNNIDDLMLSDNYVIQKHESGSYEIFEWDSICQMHLYAGRLFAPKAVELM